MSVVNGVEGETLSAHEWKKKYEESEEKLAELKRLSHQAIGDYENLQRKYDQNQKEYELLRKRLEETQEKLLKMESMLEPVAEEFQQLTQKVEVMDMCRSESERFAAKVLDQNKKLKRQSAMLLSQLNKTSVEIDITELGAITDDTTNGQDEPDSKKSAMNTMIEELQREVDLRVRQIDQLQEENRAAWESERNASHQLNLTRHEKKDLESEVVMLKKSLEEKQLALENLQKASMRVYEEAQDVQAEYDKQLMLQREAEHVAHKMLKERDAMVRQSSALLASAAPDAKLLEALNQIELVSKEKDDIKKELSEKIRDLEERLSGMDDYEAEKERLSEQMKTATSEITRLSNQVKDAAVWREKLEKELHIVSEKLDVAEQKLKPPPPPPPPPPPIFSARRIFGGKKKPGAKNDAKDGPPKDPIHQKAVDEMMARIKAGTPLKRVNRMERKGSLPGGENPAINELQKMLAGLKRSKSASSLATSTTTKLDIDSQEPVKSPKPTPAPRTTTNVKEPKDTLSIITEDE